MRTHSSPGVDVTAELAYIPVVDSAMARYQNVVGANGQGFTWWTDHDPFTHPWMLTSPLVEDHYQSGRLRAKLRYPQRFHMMFDSGGFLQFQGRFFGTPEQVSAWYNDNARAPDQCMTLDHPPFRKVGRGTFNVERLTPPEFDEKMAVSVANGKRMLELRRDPYKLLAVVHGYDLEMLERWWRAYGDGFDGYAFAPKNDPWMLLSAIVLHSEFFPEKPVHYLGVTGTRSTTVLGYLANFVRGRISYDSSAHLMGVRNLTYLAPASVRPLARLFKGDELSRLPCTCPVCENHVPMDFSGVHGRQDSLAYVPLVQHNLFQTELYRRVVVAVAANPEFYRTWVPAGARPLIRAYDQYKERGYEWFKRALPRLMEGLDPDGAAPLTDFQSTAIKLCGMCEEREARDTYDSDGREMSVCNECAVFLKEADRAGL